MDPNRETEGAQSNTFVVGDSTAFHSKLPQKFAAMNVCTMTLMGYTWGHTRGSASHHSIVGIANALSAVVPKLSD